MYTFPFEVPEDLDSLDRSTLSALYEQVKTHGQSLSADSATSLEAIDATFALFGDLKDRMDAFAAADKKTAAFSTTEPAPDAGDEPPADGDADGDGDEPPADGDSVDEPADKALVASRASLKNVAGRKRQPNDTQTPPETEPALATMTVAHDVPNHSSGAKLSSFGDAAIAIQERLLSYGENSAPNRSLRRKIEKFATRKLRRRTNIRTSSTERAVIYAEDESGHRIPMTDFTRHGAVRLNRQFPEDQRLLDGDDQYAKVLGVANERRLPGGNLMESARQLVESGRALTAAAGWCAPSETIYQLCELETMDGLLDLPEIEAARGGFNIPEDGGIDFSVIWNGIGNAGDTHLSEYDVQNDTTKVCFDIPCPDFVDTRLGVDYVCLTAGLLQRRGYPEVVERVSRGSMVALAHKINQGVISAIETAAGATNTIVADPGGDDAASALLSAVELGIWDMKYRHRMAFSSTMEVVLPAWALPVIRAALSRRSGVGMLGVTDAQILEWFTIRGAVPRFVYDWQDALSGQVGGPGAAAAILEFPATLDFLVYPAGTFTKAVQPVVNLDTIYDSTKLATNEYTAVFAEDGWAVLQTCPDARLYTVPVDVSGCVGCISAASS